MPAHQLAYSKSNLSDWWPVLLGLLVLYIPTFYHLATGLWTAQEQAHGPIILLLSCWLIYRRWPEMIGDNEKIIIINWGWLVFFVGLIFYVIGYSQQILILEISSFVLILASILLIKRGMNALKVMWFPLFFLLFMIPLPGSIVSFFTMPMKMAVSYAAENILFWADYPISRNGVILQIGQYQLLVADACAGLQTLLTLEALGLF